MCLLVYFLVLEINLGLTLPLNYVIPQYFVYVQLHGFSLTFSPDDQHLSFLGNMKNN